VWQVTETGQGERHYRFMDQVSCSDRAADFPGTPGFELAADRGRGNAFIGAGFTDPDNRSWVDDIYLAHWKTDGPAA
jgi:hypothetical protein